MEQSPSEASTPYRKLQKFELHERIGEGAMGVVWKAYDSVLRRFVALKLLNPSFGRTQDLRERFLREARAAAALQHPNIVTVYDLGESENQLFIAMELVEGRDLSELVSVRAPLPLEHKLDIVVELLQGLGYAHARGVIHRDIKPSNVRIASDGRVKIMDFGIARLQSADSTGSGGAIVGTPSYMAPEQITNGPITPGTDVFAVGCLLYELLTYERPFEAETVHGVFYQVLSTTPKPLRTVAPSIPASLERVTLKAMAKTAGERFATADEFRSTLLGIRHALSDTTNTTTTERIDLRSPLTRISLRLVAPISLRARLMVLGVLVLAVGALAYLALSAPPPPPVLPTPPPVVAAAPPLLSSLPIRGLPPALASERDSAYTARARALAVGALKNNVPAMLVGDGMLLAADVSARANDPVRAATGYSGVVAQYRRAREETDSARADATRRLAHGATLVHSIKPPHPSTSAVAALARADSLFGAKDYALAALAAADAEAQAVAAGARVRTITPQPVNNRAAITQLLEDFARAIQSRKTDNMRALYPTLTPQEAGNWQKFFDGLTGLEVTLTPDSLSVSGSSARAVVHARYQSLRAGSTTPRPIQLVYEMTFRHQKGGWRISGIPRQH